MLAFELDFKVEVAVGVDDLQILPQGTEASVSVMFHGYYLGTRSRNVIPSVTHTHCNLQSRRRYLVNKKQQYPAQLG